MRRSFSQPAAAPLSLPFISSTSFKGKTRCLLDLSLLIYASITTFIISIKSVSKEHTQTSKYTLLIHTEKDDEKHARIIIVALKFHAKD